MEKAYAYIGAAVTCLTLTVNVYAEDSSKKPEIPDYWSCAPIFLEIDYSYLRAGEWIGKEFSEKIRATFTKIHNQPNDVERTWGLVNCVF